MVGAPTDVDIGDDEEDRGPDVELRPQSVRVLIQDCPADPSLLRSMARLAVGAAAEGGDIVLGRLKTWDAEAQSLGRGIYHEGPDESRSERTRYAWVLGDRQRQGWHDKLARTRVVHAWGKPPKA